MRIRARKLVEGETENKFATVFWNFLRCAHTLQIQRKSISRIATNVLAFIDAVRVC